MDQNHALGMFFCLFWGLILWGAWYGQLILVTSLGSRPADRRLSYFMPPACVVLLELCLAVRSVAEPRPTVGEVVFGVVFGTFWLAVPSLSLAWLGLSARDDVVERRNQAAGWAIAGAQVGFTFCYAYAYAGAITGQEPFPELWPGVLATFVLFGLWAILEWRAGLSEAITVERDAGTACRLAFLLPSLGFLVGRAVALLPQATDTPQVPRALAAPLVLLLAALLVESWGVRRPGLAGEPPKTRDLAIALFYPATVGPLFLATR